jgi:transposase InsO family protein
MRYQYIREHRQEFSIKRMCQLLGVTRSGYYAWQPEKAGPRESENRMLVEQIRVEYKISRQTYGSPRIWARLRGQGLSCGRHRVARLMRREGIRPQKRHRRYPVTTQRQPGVIPAPNRLNQDFCATMANTKWVSDFTYIDTAEGWLYLAIILDLFSRKVVGWAMSKHMDTALVETALHMALQTRQPDASFLSADQGSQCGLPTSPGGYEHPVEHEQSRQLLRQCRGRKFLRHPQSRMCHSPVCHTRRSTHNDR